MKFILAIIILLSTSTLFPCDWEVIKYEPETYIYNITPMNDSELVSYSYDGKGNMYYQYSLDNGSTWEVIREEKFKEFEYQPEQVIEVIRANSHTILFVRKVRQILSFDTKTHKWDSTFTQFEGSPLGQRNYYKNEDKIYLSMMDKNKDGIFIQHIYSADTANPLNYSKSPLFGDYDEKNNWIVIEYGMYNDELYFSNYINGTYFNQIYKYNVISKKLDTMFFNEKYQFVKFYVHNNELYFADAIESDDGINKTINNGFYKYNPISEESELIYKFDHSYYDEPELIELTDDTYALRVTNKYYLFKNDVFYKIQGTPGANCEECTDRLESFSYNKYNDYFYYTTRGFCLFRSGEFYDEFISDPKAGVLSLADESLPSSYVLNDNHISFDTKQGERVQSISLYDLSGSSIEINDWQQSGELVNINLQPSLSTGVYMLIITTNQRVQEVKLMKR